MKLLQQILRMAGVALVVSPLLHAQPAPTPLRGGGTGANRPITIDLASDTAALAPGGALAAQIPPYSRTVPLGLDRPEHIAQEPAYNGTPLYGTIRLGNSWQSRFTVVIDHPKAGAWEECRVYVDANRNGDLTDDGDGRWTKSADRAADAPTRLGPNLLTLRASYSSGRDDVESRDARYGVMLSYGRASPDQPMELTLRRTTARVGSVKLVEREHRVALVENDNDAIYLLGKGEAGKPVWLLVDADDDGKFSESERHDIRGGLSVGGMNFVARPAADGSKLMLTPFTGPMPDRATAGSAPRPPRLELLANGKAAPDFKALKPDGSELRLADYRGKIVVLDFWATWCGPCIASMPSLEKLHQNVGSQGVEVLGICVWDKREAFDKWLVEPRVKTTYTKAFDPAGADPDNANAESIAKKFYNVSAIPTFYVIDREGKIAASFLGSGEESRKGLENTLIKLGVKL